MRVPAETLQSPTAGSTSSGALNAHRRAGCHAPIRRSSHHTCSHRTVAACSKRPQRGALLVTAAVKKQSGKNVACTKTLVAREGKAEAVQALCAGVVEYSRRRMQEQQSGIISFDCHKDNFEPNVFHFWELYEGNVALGRHSTSPEVVQFMERVQGLLEGPVGMALYEMKDGKLGSACVQGGPRGEGGLDDATGASGGAGGASYKQTSGAVDLTQVEEKEDEGRGLWGIKFKLPWNKD